MNDFEDLPLDVSIWTYVKEQFMERTYMPSWSILNYLCKEWSGSFYLVQFVELIVVNVAICYVARKYTKHHFLFLILFFLSEIFFQLNTEVCEKALSVPISWILLANGASVMAVAYALTGGVSLAHIVRLIVMKRYAYK